MKVEINNSSLISFVEYSEEKNELTIHFKNYFVENITYVNFYHEWFEEFMKSESPGKFYLNHIKPNFKTQKKDKMADKIIKCKINVREIVKKWIFAGEKGDYLNFTVLYNETKDGYGNNGMIIQDVPTEIYKKEKEERVPADKQSRGPILGNCTVFQKSASASEESMPGKEIGKMGASIDDDLPF